MWTSGDQTSFSMCPLQYHHMPFVSSCLSHKVKDRPPLLLRSPPSLIMVFPTSSPHRCAIRFLVAPSRQRSPSRTLGGRARSAAGSPSRLGRTAAAAGLAVGESSALLTHTPLAIAGGTGMWDGDAEDPALRSVSPSFAETIDRWVFDAGIAFGATLSPFLPNLCSSSVVTEIKKRLLFPIVPLEKFSRLLARMVQAAVEVWFLLLVEDCSFP